MSRMRERQDTKLYYSISEASAIAKVKPHVLRYWETQFKMLRPKKNKAGNRMYRKRDLKLIQHIKELLYDRGYTIAGARRKLLDDRAALREQIEIAFTEVDRSVLLAEIVRDVRGLLDDLRKSPGEAAAAAEQAERLEEAEALAAGLPDGDLAGDDGGTAGLEPGDGLDPDGGLDPEADLDADAGIDLGVGPDGHESAGRLDARDD